MPRSITCSKCKGEKTIVIAATVINGELKETKVLCHECKGKGYTDQRDNPNVKYNSEGDEIHCATE